MKLPPGGDTEALELFEASGLGSAVAVPAVASILPIPLEGPADPQERVEAICASIHRLAPFRPAGIVCLTGAVGELDEDRAREIVVDGLRTIGAEAERAGLRVGVEPLHRKVHADWTIVASIPEAVDLIDEADHPALGLQFDTWHLWDTESLAEHIERECHRFVGVHVADWRDPTRSWADRVLPGDGVIDLATIFGMLERAGWDGFYDLELFSDNGTFGNAWPDSLWEIPTGELAQQGKGALASVWEARIRERVLQVRKDG